MQQQEEFVQETRTYEALSYVDEATKRSVGYEAENFIIDCQFAGYPCYTWYVTRRRRRRRRRRAAAS